VKVFEDVREIGGGEGIRVALGGAIGGGDIEGTGTDPEEREGANKAKREDIWLDTSGWRDGPAAAPTPPSKGDHSMEGGE